MRGLQARLALEGQGAQEAEGRGGVRRRSAPLSLRCQRAPVDGVAHTETDTRKRAPPTQPQGGGRSCGRARRLTGYFSSGSMSRASPKMSLQYSAILACCFGLRGERRGGGDARGRHRRETCLPSPAGAAFIFLNPCLQFPPVWT